MDAASPLKRAFQVQAEFCRCSGADFSGAVLDALAPHVEGDLGGFFTAWAGAGYAELIDAAVALRLLGALHALVLDGRDPRLAAAYPPTPAPQRLAELAPAAALRHAGSVVEFLCSPPQTNEVRRAFALAAGFLRLADQTGLPLRCFEIGASAGLNSLWPFFRFRFGLEPGNGPAFGDPASPVALEGGWRGPPPSLPPVRVVERAACDLHPVRLDDPFQRLRLQAYVWAGQEERLARLKAAIGLAGEHGVEVDAAPAPAWVAARAAPRVGAATVVFHSVMWQYLSDAEHAELDAALAAHGAAATTTAPFAHLAFEPVDRGSHAAHEVRLTTWPGGRTRLLARGHPHARWIEPVG